MEIKDSQSHNQFLPKTGPSPFRPLPMSFPDGMQQEEDDRETLAVPSLSLYTGPHIMLPTTPRPGLLEQQRLFTPPPSGTTKPAPVAQKGFQQPVSPPSSRHSAQWKKRVMVVGAVLGSLIVISGMFFLLWARLQAASEVVLYQVSVKQATLSIGGGGIIFPHQRFDLSYPVAERVLDVFVNAGDEVVPDQPLLRLDPTRLTAQIKQAADNVAAAQSYLDAVSAGGNTVDIAQAQQQYTLAKNRYNALIAQSTYPLLHEGDLVSPMKGVITAVHINPGETFGADSVLLTIMDEETVVVRAKVPLANLGQVEVEQPATITPSARPDRQFIGTIIAIIPQADPQTDTFEVWVDVGNPDRELLPGMSAFVHLQKTWEGIVAPRLAVLNPDKDPVVFVVREQHVYLQRVQVMGRSGDTILISNGLFPGDQIVLVGLDSLQNGQEIQVKSIEI